MQKVRMMNDVAQCIDSDIAVTDVCMAILACAPLILTVIDMKKGDILSPNQLIKSVNYPVEIIDDIISGIVQMTGIHADAQLIVVRHFIENDGQLLKAASDFRTLSGHCFQCDITGVSVQHIIQPLSDSVNTGLYAGAYLYEHREQADHRELAGTLRSLLFGIRKEVF